jgi:hypothetical protein
MRQPVDDCKSEFDNRSYRLKGQQCLLEEQGFISGMGCMGKIRFESDSQFASLAMSLLTTPPTTIPTERQIKKTVTKK